MAASWARCSALWRSRSQRALPVPWSWSSPFPDQPTPVRGVAVGTDGSSGADAAVRFAAEHAAATSSPLRRITCTGEQAPVGISEDQLHDAAQRIANAAWRVVHETHPQLSVVSVVENGTADRAIVNASAATELVVVGTRGRGAFHGMLLGSVSHAVMHGARCPVAVIGADRVSRDADVVGSTGPDIVDVWGYGSFLASEPPANW
jgi:nucleotide-binding universal stress UspA family protein